jgi:hypothetical protein
MQDKKPQKSRLLSIIVGIILIVLACVAAYSQLTDDPNNPNPIWANSMIS